MWSQTAYAILEGNTLTFKYGSKPNVSNAWNLPDDAFPGWYNSRNVITKVVFDNSFASARPSTCGSWFFLCENLLEIDGLSNLNTEEVTDMSAMFYDCKKIQSLNLSSFDTQNVTDMSSMFNGCLKLTSLNLNGFNTQKVTDMSAMFSDCEEIESLNLSSFDTSNVTNMMCMFTNCKSLTELDIRHFMNIKVTSMSAMFSGCSSITSIKMTTSISVEDMSNMFEGCENLTDLDLSQFYTAGVTNMAGMFFRCCSLETLDVSTFNTSRVQNMGSMFCMCYSLKKLDVSHFKTSNVTDMSNMFSYCEELKLLDVYGINTSKVTKMNGMFEKCSKLIRLDLHSFNVSNVTTTKEMFTNCASLEKIICDGDWSGISESTDMFSGCTNLKGAIEFNPSFVTATYANKTTGYFSPFYYYIAEVSNDHMTLTFRRSETAPNGTTQWDATRTGYEEIDYNETGDDDFEPDYTFHGLGVSKVVFDESFKDARPNSCYSWFLWNSQLTTIEGLEYFNTSEVTNMSHMFYGCNKLSSLDLRHFNMSNVEKLACMFYGCTNLETIFSDEDWNNNYIIDDGGYMFYGCRKLKGAISYNSSKTDIQYANPYTGYFTSLEDEITVPLYSICTYCSRFDLDFTNVTGLKAYIISGFSPSTCTLTLTPVTAVRAGEGLLLKGDAGEYVVPHTTTDMIYSNLLVGVPTTTYVYPTDGENTNFILANGSHGVNFYTLSEAGNIAAGKAYLQLPTSELPSSARSFKFEFGDDDITGIKANLISEDAAFYDLQGRKVLQPSKGLYIVNGKKVIIK